MTPADPMAEFLQWFAAAQSTELHDATAMALATTDEQGNPSVRMVLLKHADAAGFVFYTNLDSPKSIHLRRHARASLCFHWPKLERQVRVDGAVVPVSAAEADAYFATRPRVSQLGAWASEQSKPLPNRLSLETAVAVAGLRFGTAPVPRPPHWSGWRVVPDRIEFWQQQLFRLHDRRVFVRGPGGWTMDRLFP